MSGALARQWDYDYSAEDYFEKEPELELEQETNEPTNRYSSPSRYVRQFERLSPQLETNYQYAYSYHKTLRPRRVVRIALLDQLLAAVVVFPRRGVLLAVCGLFGCVGLVISALSILPRQSEEEQVYQFEGTNLAPAQAQKPAAPQAVASGTYALLRSPTINAERINAVLQQYNSPATGTGQAIYDLGVRYGIDPAYALAFFIQESSAGTQGVAAVTKSLGNIRCTSGYECYQTTGNGSFRRYSSWEAGAEDWYRLIKDLYVTKWNLKTLEQIIPVYAPSADRNNPAAYIRQVARLIENF